MRKYWLLLLSLTASTSVYAMSANEQMDAVKGLFINEFNQIDTNKDGKISQDEYLAFQFNNLRNNVLAASGFATENKEPAPIVQDTPSTLETVSEDEIIKVPESLKAMAEFDIDMDDLELPVPTDIPVTDNNEETNAETEEISEDEIAKLHKSIGLDLSMSEDESLQNLLKEMEETTVSGDAAEGQAGTAETDQELQKKEKDKQINMMMKTIKKTLPKKIDAITTWTNIEYKDSTISYIYKADMDTSTLSEAEKASLELNIKNEACLKAYTDMCPKVKPMFIDEGIDVEIRYYDNQNTELSSCKFNQETCSDI